ncbi:MAG: type IV toxin-antitoxin system AbiEi family antitoxin domain-containing protein [Acidimicrobiales bacterium]
MATDRRPERRLFKVMARQHGLATRRQAADVGITRGTLEHLLAQGLPTAP